jgi:phosphoglycerate kinase
MKLKSFPAKMNLRGKRVLVRVDWNIRLGSKDGASKISQSIPWLKELKKRGAIVILLTHLGRPEGRDPQLSTAQLAEIANQKFRLGVLFHPTSISDPESRAALRESLKEDGPGTIHLLENVRFESGETKNDPALAKAFASLGDVFVNDAFASCHDVHASVVGVAKHLPSFAGPNLSGEVTALSRLIEKPKHPFISFVGGAKVADKEPVLKVLVQFCDAVCVGSSYVADAKRFLKQKKIIMPLDVVQVDGAAADVGSKTLAMWRPLIKKAKTILWNGPVGITKDPATIKGSLALARMIAKDRPSSSFAIAGGGDTVPVILSTKTVKGFTFVSMGGGALLQFIAKKGKLPGLLPLMKK